ncbi:hypothetical protein [Providencia sp. Me31A]|uniref:hypothetical protein n=1 Tax=Providencia sp. Me31A TaxID=3392637 RepID=UPI003D2C97A1
MDSNLFKLRSYIENLKIKYDIKNKKIENFPSKKDMNIDVNIQIFIEQATELLNHPKIAKKILGIEIEPEDNNILINFFIHDIEQYATLNNLDLNNHSLHYGQYRISGGALFHYARSKLLPNTYKTIDQVSIGDFDSYSIPFKIRLSLEDKIKSIIGFDRIESIDLKGNKVISKEMPMAYILKKIEETDSLNLPCSINNIRNIYQWSCSFCHTGVKEPIWLMAKAIDLISPLFNYESQKKYEINCYDLWSNDGLSENDLVLKMKESGTFSQVLYFFKKDWSIKKFEDAINNSDKKKYKLHGVENTRFYLEEKNLDEVFHYYCGKREQVV